MLTLRYKDYSWTQAIHDLSYEITQPQDISECFAGVIASRTMAAFGLVRWAIEDVALFIPRITIITVDTLLNHAEGISFKLLSSIAKSHAIFFAAVLLDGVAFAAACILPELVYMEKMRHALICAHVQALFSTAVDYTRLSSLFPQDSEQVTDLLMFARECSLDIDALYTDLIYDVEQEVLKDLSFNERLELLYFSPKICTLVQSSLAKRIAQGVNESSDDQRRSFIEKFLRTGLEVKEVVFGSLDQRVKEQLIRLEPKLADLEYISSIRLESANLYKFRSPLTIQLCKLLRTNMKEAASFLDSEGIYTKDDIASMMGNAYPAVIDCGILQFVDSLAHEKEAKRMLFTGLDRNSYPLFHEKQFFGYFSDLLSLKEKLNVLSPGLKAALLMRLYHNEEYVLQNCDGVLPEGYENKKVQECYNLIVRIRVLAVEKGAMKIVGVSPHEAVLDWSTVFN